jgi:hypothetical protein
MTMTTTRFRIALVCSALLLAPVFGTALADTPTTQAEVEQKINELKARLALTPEQEASIKPLAEQRYYALQALQTKYAGDTSPKARRAMLKEAKGIQAEYVSKVEPLLTDAQKTEWKKIREEMRAELSKRWQARSN